MRRILLPCSLVLLMAGCWGAPTVDSLSDAGSWVIPVIPSKIEKLVDDSELPVQPSSSTAVDDGPEMVIVVPPSDKPTTVEVRRTKRTIIDKALTNKPAFQVKSDNKGVTAAQPKQTVWWKWIAAGVGCLLLIVLVVMVIAQKVANFSPWGFVLKLFRKG